ARRSGRRPRRRRAAPRARPSRSVQGSSSSEPPGLRGMTRSNMTHLDAIGYIRIERDRDSDDTRTADTRRRVRMFPETMNPAWHRRLGKLRGLGAALVVAGTLAGAATITGCAVNPATGSRQFTLFSEAQEIE